MKNRVQIKQIEKREHTTAVHRLILHKKEKKKEEMSEKIFLVEIISLNINKEICNCKGGKAIWFYQAVDIGFRW